ncbi:MAG: TolC family protein [Bacteroidota bacterium]
MNNNLVNRRKALYILLSLFLLGPAAGSLQAQGDEASGSAYSLEQCIAYAMRNQKNIQNATFDKYIAQKRVKELIGIGLPQVTGSAQYQAYIQLPVSLIDIGNFQLDPTSAIPQEVLDTLPDAVRYQSAQFGVNHNLTLGAQITQLLFDGTFFVGIRAAREFTNLQEINIRRTEVETAVAVTNAYYTALLNEERARLLTSNLERITKLVANTDALYKEGFAEKVDVDRLTITRNNLQRETKKTTALVALGYDLLKFQMGMPIEEELRLSERIVDLANVPQLEDLTMEGNFAQGRIEYQQLQQGIVLQEMDRKRNAAATWGSLVAFGNYNYQTFRPRFFSLDVEDKWFSNSFVGLSYNVTFFDGLQKRSRIQKIDLEISKLRNQADVFEQSVLLELRNASTQVVNAWTDVEAAEKNQELAEEVYRISTTKYREGIGSNLEVIDAENSLTQSQINYLTALYNYVLATVELKRVKGEISPYDTSNPDSNE